MPIPQDEIVLDFTKDGHMINPWWTKEAEVIMKTVGNDAPGYEQVNTCPWCG